MKIIPVQEVLFDDKATLVMGEAFDHACVALCRSGNSVVMREMIAKRIIGAATNGERDPARLYRQALRAFRIEDMPMMVVRVGGYSPVPA